MRNLTKYHKLVYVTKKKQTHGYIEVNRGFQWGRWLNIVEKEWEEQTTGVRQAGG